MHGAGMSASEKPANTLTAEIAPAPSRSAARAASTARCIAPLPVALRRVCDINGSGCQRTTGVPALTSVPVPANIASSKRPACAPVSYMSTCG